MKALAKGLAAGSRAGRITATGSVGRKAAAAVSGLLRGAGRARHLEAVVIEVQVLDVDVASGSFVPPSPVIKSMRRKCRQPLEATTCANAGGDFPDWGMKRLTSLWQRRRLA
jgi:hypothetical protein